MSINTGRFVLQDGENIQAVKDSISGRGIINTAPDFGKAIKTFDTGIEKGLENIIKGSSTSEVKSAVGIVGKKLGLPLGEKTAAVIDVIDSNGVIDRAFRGLTQAKNGVKSLASACLNDFLSGMNCNRNTASSGGRYLNASECSIDALSNIVGGLGGRTSNIFDPCALQGMLKSVVGSSANAGLGEVYKSLAPAFDPQVVLGAGIDLASGADFPLIKEISESGFAKEVGSVVGGVGAVASKYVKSPLSSGWDDVSSALNNFDSNWSTNNGKTSTAKLGSGMSNMDFTSTVSSHFKSNNFSNTSLNGGGGNSLATAFGSKAAINSSNYFSSMFG